MAATRADQYTTNKERDMYIDSLAEDELDEGNPFQQTPGDAAIADPDEAAVAALLSRKEPAATQHEVKDASSTPSEQDADEPTTPADGDSPPKGLEERIIEKPTAKTLEENGNTPDSPSKDNQEETETRNRPSHATNKLKHPRGPLMDAVSEDISDFDSGTQHPVKRARYDSRSLIIEPGDDAAEENAKMRANLIQRGVLIGEEVKELERNEEDTVAADGGDSADRPVAVEPVLLMDRPGGKSPVHRGRMPGGEGDDEYADMEAKGDDDYDPGNYARFEDDEDDMGEVEGRDGTAVPEEGTIDEEELVPGPEEGTPLLHGR